jgi:diadenosine tetraphosphate (Ap4A) HIT family hydrolase
VLTAQRDAGTAPLWDCIYRTQFWDVVHSYNSAVPGWLVLVLRRHAEAIDELTDDEAIELGLLIRRVSLALRETTGCFKTYVVQFAEAAEHLHVHFHIIPRMADQPDDRRSVNVFRYLGVPETERVSEDTMNDIAVNIQNILSGFPNSGLTESGEST